MSERRALLFVADLVLVNVSILAGLWLWKLGSGENISWQFIARQWYWYPALNVLWLISSTLISFYDLNVASRFRYTARALVQQAGILLAAYILIYFLSSPGSLPRLFVLYSVAFSFGLVGSWRLIYIVYLGTRPFQRRAMIVGNGGVDILIDVIQNYGGSYFQIVGCVGDMGDAEKESPLGFPVLASSSELSLAAQKLGASEIIFAPTKSQNERLVRSLIDCQEQGIPIIPFSTIYEELTGSVPLDIGADDWIRVLPLQHPGTGVIFPIVKRCIDIMLSAAGLLILGLIFPFVTLAIWLDSSRPIFYVQNRLGKGGRVFKTYKFRSMGMISEQDGKAVWAERSDPRVTRVGRILRATHIDEFPQFLNILKGDMSAVGPRPERPELAVELEKNIPFYRLRHSVRPGMAGWALIKQGYSGSVSDARIKLQYDLYYIKHQSLWLDMIILLKTFVDAVTLRGR